MLYSFVLASASQQWKPVLYVYSFFLSLSPLPRHPHPPEHQSPRLGSLCYLATSTDCFTHELGYMSVLLSQFVLTFPALCLQVHSLLGSSYHATILQGYFPCPLLIHCASIIILNISSYCYKPHREFLLFLL